MKKREKTVKGPFKKIKKLVRWTKRKCTPPAEFLRAGRPGGMIMCALLGMQFLYALVTSSLAGVIPPFVLCLISLALIVAGSELAALILKLFFHGNHRSQTYFCAGFIGLMAANYAATMDENIDAAVIMNFLMVLAVDLIGRIVWAFVRKRKFRQVFGYVVFALSAMYFGLYAAFLNYDNFGENRISFYLDGVTADDVQSVEGFDTYLKAGPHKVMTLDYGPSDGTDIKTERFDLSTFAEREGITGYMTGLTIDDTLEEAPVAGRIWYPEGEEQCPVFFIVHGNHDASTPSYLGYDYLGEYLASHGYAVVSVDENIVNELTSENDARAVLLLENIKAVLEENARTGSPVFNLIDPDKIAIGGHSRGGEMIATAYLFNSLEAYPDDGNERFDYNFNITSLVAIAPCVDQYMPGEHAVHIEDVNYLLIHGSNDQDVYSMMGSKQYNNITFSESSYDPEEPDEYHLKASVYCMGANHGQFNTRWGRYDIVSGASEFLNTANFISKEDQELIADAYIRVFLDQTLLGDNTYASLLYDNTPYLSALPGTVYVTDYMDSTFTRLCSFDDSVDLMSGDLENVEVNCAYMDRWHVTREMYGSGIEENYVLSCKWYETAEPEIHIMSSLTDLSSGGISFRIADMREDAGNNEPLTCKVKLFDMNGNSVITRMPVRVYPSLGVQLYKQDVLFGNYEFKHQMQTVTLTTDMFIGPPDFDYSTVCHIAICLDGTADGEVILDDVCCFEKRSAS